MWHHTLIEEISSQVQPASSGIEFQLVSSCAIPILILCEETVWVNTFFACQNFVRLDEITSLPPFLQ